MMRILTRAAALWAAVTGPLAVIGAIQTLSTSSHASRALPALLTVDAVLVLGPLAVVIALRWIFAPRR